jgi:hypothetical protein
MSKIYSEPTCHRVDIGVLVFGWKNTQALKEEIEDMIHDRLYDHQDLEVKVVGDDDSDFPFDKPTKSAKKSKKKAKKKK